APAVLAQRGLLRHEASVLASLAEVAGIARSRGLEEHAGRLGIVCDDGGPWSVDHVLERERLPLEVALRLAYQLADTLDGVHRAGGIPKDVKPQNIALHQHLDPAVPVGFGLASRLGLR